MSDAIIRAESLTKHYGKGNRGIVDVTFDVQKGEVFGFLGPNGAGKTTAIRTILDIIRPNAGGVSVFGLDSKTHADAIHARVGYLPSDAGLSDRMTVREQLDYYANLRGGVPRERVNALAQRFELDLTRVVGALSRGNRQKVGIVQAFMHEPELLILDEPTTGLDPLMQQEFNALVRETAARGATVFLSSHILPEVETLCQRVAIIREGKIVDVERVEAIRDRAVRGVRARFARDPSVGLVLGLVGVSEASVDGKVLSCKVQGPTADLVRRLATDDLVDLTIHDPSLEDVFLGYYARGRRE